ncbi:MAG: hypothetical protein WKF84_09725 [Pyrinomonadaceae bacterium]
MNLPKVSAEDYINFLIATPLPAPAWKAGAWRRDEDSAPAHDAFTGVSLHSARNPDAATLWREARGQVSLSRRHPRR